MKDRLPAIHNLHAEIEAASRTLAEQHADRLQCGAGCADCCIDDLTVFEVEAQTIRANYPDLLAHVRAPLERFEAALLRAVPEVLHVDGERAARLGVVFLSLAHMFDSEAVTFAVYPNPALEAARLEWATAVLSDELRALGLS